MNSMPRLSVELVPRRAWYRSVRAVVADGTWDALRWYFGASQTRPQFLSIAFPNRPHGADHACAYCGAKDTNLELHEEWHYDDAKRVQSLVGLKPSCPKCHLAKHLGHANVIGRSAEALAHLATVNGWTPEEAKVYRDQVFAEWESRKNIEYTLDVGYLTQYVPATKIHMEWLDKPHKSVGSRLDAIMWASELLESDAIILDTETTGKLDKSNVEVIELAAISMKGKTVYHSLFKPRYKIPGQVIQIHGITNEDVQSSPTFAQEAKAIAAVLNGKTIVAYNAKFDRGVMARTCALHKIETIDARWECAMRAYKIYLHSAQNVRLPGGSHRALDDCNAVHKLIEEMAHSAIL